MVIPQSGPFSNFGEDSINAAEIAKDRFDGSVNGRSIEILTRDSETAADVAVPAATELIQQEDIDFLMGGVSSSAAIAMGDVTQRESVPFQPLGTSQAFTGENFNEYIFHHSPHSFHIAVGVGIGYSEGVFESLYGLHYDYQSVNVDAAANRVESLGGTNVGFSETPLGNDDFSAQISDIRSSGADAVFVSLGGSDMINFITQADSAGLIDEMEIILSMGNEAQAEVVGPEVMSGIYASTCFNWQLDGAEDFVSEARDLSGKVPRWWQQIAFEGSMEFFDAVKRADGSSDANTITSQLEGHNFDWLKPATWRECDHKSNYEMLLQVGKTANEMEGDSDYFEIVGQENTEGSVPSCSDRGF
jgi:branched-chain amino acid transport system substrate-binding protein